jgi:hypothetical protein
LHVEVAVRRHTELTGADGKDLVTHKEPADNRTLARTVLSILSEATWATNQLTHPRPLSLGSYCSHAMMSSNFKLATSRHPRLRRLLAGRLFLWVSSLPVLFQTVCRIPL